MDAQSTVVATRTKSPWWEVRSPVLAYCLAGLFLLQVLIPLFSRNDAPWSVWATVSLVLLPLVAALEIGAATATLVHRKRLGLPTNLRAPLAQESDPRLR